LTEYLVVNQTSNEKVAAPVQRHCNVATSLFPCPGIRIDVGKRVQRVFLGSRDLSVNGVTLPAALKKKLKKGPRIEEPG
jgi:hypothetical protein